MSLRAHITEVKKEFYDELRGFLEEHCSLFVAVGESAESDFQEWEIDWRELESLIKGIESGEIRCPDLGNKSDPNFVCGLSLLVWLKKLVLSSPDSSFVTID